MFHIIGKITKRIMTGEIDNGAVFPAKRGEGSPPKTSSIRYGEGHGFGKGSTRKRSGKGSKTDG